MYDKAIELLKELEKHGYTAYIVGGYVRDKLLGKESNDIDICTSATPKEIMDIFDIAKNNGMQYGAVTVIYKNYKYDVTTFRREIKYEDNRKPVKIKYINDLKKDLLRRDFTINTLCINSSEQIVDILGVKQDIDNKIIRTVGNPRYKIKEDSLRILRAIRFASILDFEIENKTKYYLSRYKNLLINLSYQRKKEELNKIFLSVGKDRGKDLLLDLKLDKVLELNNLKKTIMCNDVIGIWAQLEVDNIYPFTKLEKEQMKQIRLLLKEDNKDSYILYKYGLYLNSVCAEIKNIPKKEINTIYNNLPILTRSDIKVSSLDIAKALNKKPNGYIKDIFIDIEQQIINKSLVNDHDIIIDYIIKKYKEHTL